MDAYLGSISGASQQKPIRGSHNEIVSPDQEPLKSRADQQPYARPGTTGMEMESTKDIGFELNQIGKEGEPQVIATEHPISGTVIDATNSMQIVKAGAGGGSHQSRYHSTNEVHPIVKAVSNTVTISAFIAGDGGGSQPSNQASCPTETNSNNGNARKRKCNASGPIRSIHNPTHGTYDFGFWASQFWSSLAILTTTALKS
ncbi:hypothetical protein VNO77_34032 [Canavalia gladiata]|uniref:Uncharacterized protein n=1 Tax=Canavalia gladiata TaxID=3824 RepID=A0AAN9PYX4_CANGL